MMQVTRQLGRSRNRCDGDGRDLCVFTNLCVDHARHNTFVVFEDIDYHMYVPAGRGPERTTITIASLMQLCTQAGPPCAL
jgi:hypothetical protein